MGKLLTAAKKRAEVASESSVSDHCTLGKLAAERLEITQTDISTKSSTKKFERDIHASLFRFCPELEEMDIRKVSDGDCRQWAFKHGEHYAANRFNWSVSVMKQIFELAIDQGFRATNPARKLKRAKIVEKDLGLILPQPDKFAEWVAEIRIPRNRWSKHCADWVEFQAYSGLRPDNESPFVQWKHCDFTNNELVVTGDPENEGTKNRTTRRIPMNGNLLALLTRMRSEREDEDLKIWVLQVSTARKAMKRAASVVGIEDLKPYDLRHLFATRCLESGVDAATAANWLGHKDKGALILRVYNHVRNAHSHAAAAKVSF